MTASTSDGHGADSKIKAFVDVSVQTKLSGDDIDNTLNNLHR